MTREQHFNLFVKGYTRKDGVTPTMSYKEKYGEMSFEESFETHWKSCAAYMVLMNKIDRFENRLIALGAVRENSNISESRYYQYDGYKFRFSSHVYPTGSMTNELLKVYDFAADPELINIFVK